MSNTYTPAWACTNEQSWTIKDTAAWSEVGIILSIRNREQNIHVYIINSQQKYFLTFSNLSSACVCTHTCMLNHLVMCNSVTPRIAAQQAPLFMGFSRQEHWSGLSFPPPGDFLDPGIEPISPALAGGFFTTESLSHYDHDDFFGQKYFHLLIIMALHA